MPTNDEESTLADGETPPDDSPPQEDSAEAQRRMYIADLIRSGKAAVAKDGKLPPGATHEIVGTDADGQPILVRRRFS
jgi:hypothetical protein